MSANPTILSAISDKVNNTAVQTPPSEAPPPLAMIRQSRVLAETSDIRRKIKVFLQIAGVIILVVFLAIYGPKAVMRGLVWVTEKSRGAPVIIVSFCLILMFVVWGTLCIPFITTLEILSGFILGFGPAAIVNVLGLLLTCVSSFLMGRRFLRSSLKSWITEKAPKWNATFNVVERKGLRFLILLRLLAIPFWTKNYGPGSLLDAPLKDFAFSVLVATCPYGVLYAYIGDRSQAITADVSDSPHKTGSGVLVLEFGLILLALAATVYVSVWAVGIFREAEKESAQNEASTIGRELTSVKHVILIDEDQKKGDGSPTALLNHV